MVSRVSNALRMLILLKSRGKMKIKDIAEELEVSKREVRRYKDDLEMAHIHIESIPGKYGGYVYKDKDYLLYDNLTKEEFSIILTSIYQLQQTNAIYCTDCKILFDKINAIKNMYWCSKASYTKCFVKSIKPTIDCIRHKSLWFDLTASIVKHTKMQIKYKGINGNVSKRVIRPYCIFQYKEDLYCIAYCEYRNEIRQFKISRIKKYEILTKKFDKDKNFKVEEYMDNCFGIYKDDEIDLVLKIKYPMATIIKEKQWTTNQQIVEKDDHIIFKAKMKGKTEIKSWILSMGSDVEVMHPLEFRQEIIKDLKQILNIYT